HTDHPDLSRPASPNFTLEPYSLNYPRMGRCIIVNQKFFAPSTNLDTRHGTDEDVRSLAWSFTRLHFQVDVIHNRTVDELRSVISELSAFDHSRYASFVLCLLSHGERGFVYGHDGKLLLREVLDVFSPERCPSLKGKPKLLILQACRGDREDAGVPVKDRQKQVKDQLDSKATPTLPEDFVLTCATTDGYVSYRDSSTGTPFIQKLCRVFDSSDVASSHILEILTRVCRALSVEFGNSARTKQTATVTSNLNKLFYLKPRPQASSSAT
ncbi:caspase-3-like, partial [Tropilaelaps mercedesae]